MPTTLADFNTPTRLIRVTIEADLTNTGMWADYTQYLDNYTIINTSNDKLYGIADLNLNAELFIPNPTGQWVRPGIPVRAKVTTSNDNWVTSYSEYLFWGTTSRQNTIPTNKVNIKATSYNSNYLDQRLERSVYINQDTNDIITDLLVRVGVDVSNISLTPSGIVLPVYPINDNQPIRDFIEDLCLPNLQIVGFNKDNVFTSKSLQLLTIGGSGFTPDVVTDLATITDYSQQELSSKFYANTLKVTGKVLEYVDNGALYYDNQIQGQEIKPNSDLFFKLEIPDVQPLFINQFVARSRPASGTVQFFAGMQNKSYYDFFETDDGAGAANNTGISIVSQSIAEESGVDILFIKFRNNSSDSKFLKTIAVNGQGVKKTGDLQDKVVNSTLIKQDGGEVSIELSGSSIQDDVVLGNILSTLKSNVSKYADVYQFEMRGKPKTQVGNIIEFKDRNNNTKTGIIYETDIECSIDRGYTQQITAKVLENVTYGEWDNVASLWDTAIWF